jgi:diguanylate cyclase (GGDEF)-like protein
VPLVAVVLAAATVLAAAGRVLLSLRDLRSLSESRREALTDDLTGLANRRMFNRQLTATLAACAARPEGEDTRIAVLLIDMDRFKEINDSFGHPVGDEVLREIAERLRPGLRSSDLLARLGGDEFALLLDGSDTDYANGVAKRLTADLAQPFPLAQASFELGASIGIARYPDDATDAAELLRCADVAMYRAKAAKVAYTVYDHAHDDSRDRFELVADLRRAIEQRKLTLHYQPQLDLDTGLVVGVEALARWTHPTKGFIPPDTFIPLAEGTGLMSALTTFVLDTAFAQCAAWRDAGRDLTVAVNLSASDLLDHHLYDNVERLLVRYSLPAEALILEITESVLLADITRAHEVVQRLQALGITVSIDDFGTGFSSLVYLRNLAVSELKVDRAFITGLGAENADRDIEIVRSVIDLAHRLGLRVVAEGIEDGNALRRLIDLGCDLAQGYHIGRPVPAEQLGPFTPHPSRLSLASVND